MICLLLQSKNIYMLLQSKYEICVSAVVVLTRCLCVYIKFI